MLRRYRPERLGEGLGEARVDALFGDEHGLGRLLGLAWLGLAHSGVFSLGERRGDARGIGKGGVWGGDGPLGVVRGHPTKAL